MRRGFSLVELSIVLVILGLLVGGVLGGQSLIRAAELRSITTDLNAFSTALNGFQAKYNAVPGDMTNAIDYWGAAHATPATCQTTVGTGTQTCNGNGNGRIDFATYEAARAWQQLSNAGLVAGQFSGVLGASYVAGTNMPKGKIAGSMYIMNYGQMMNGTPKFVLIFAHTNQGAADPPDSILTPEDAYSVDAKIDDGLPRVGNVNGVTGDDAPDACGNGATPTSPYNLSSTSRECYLLFSLG